MGTWAYLGIMCYVANTEIPGHIPLYRAWNGSDHFYTTSKDEYDNLPNTYTREGIACYVLDQSVAEEEFIGPRETSGHVRIVGGARRLGEVRLMEARPLLPMDARLAVDLGRLIPTAAPGFGHMLLHRLYQAQGDNHFYCTNASDIDFFIEDLGYTDEGIIGYVATSPGRDSNHFPLYYAYHPTIVDHFYTIDMQEIENMIPTLSRDKLRNVIKWKLEHYLTDDADIYIADSAYHSPTRHIARKIIESSQVDQRRYISEKHDCDDFAHLLKSAFIEAAYTNELRPNSLRISYV